MLLDSSRPKDARVRRSRESMRRALLDLLQTKPYDEISIRDVTGAAGVSYPTFFRSYASKAELLGDIGANETRDLFAAMIAVLDHQDPALTATTVCDFIRSRSDLWRVLLDSEAVFAMRRTFIGLAVDLVQRRSRMLPDVPIELSATFFVGSMFDLLSWWLRQTDEVPIDQMSRYLETLVTRPTMT